MPHILVVDDEESIRDVLKHALEHFGYKVTVAANGDEGLKHFNSDHFVLVITDIRMPIKDGYELAKSIRNSDSPDTPIIAITAYPKNIKKESVLFNSIIAKPFDLLTLKRIIRQHLESNLFQGMRRCK